MAAENNARGFVVRRGGRELLKVLKREGNRILAQEGDYNVWLSDGTYYYTHLLSTEPPESKRKSVGELTVDLDCSEALTGLKAVQREAKAAARALKDVEEAGKATDLSDYKRALEVLTSETKPPGTAEYFWQKARDISRYSTAELADELAQREGVDEERAAHGDIVVHYADAFDGQERAFRTSGPARIVVNHD
ncbi:hypothetical protein [Thalassobacillus sp. CUG 92003]|uniref:hypothetical protein n=1 Tax=Thalassobacillus sp. CUG 92003 TaxID=2736641 RepID=UPI0015E72170|nr:hypothetical protein [Thalassobacillus sp. CUG 92003]